MGIEGLELLWNYDSVVRDRKFLHKVSCWHFRKRIDKHEYGCVKHSAACKA